MASTLSGLLLLFRTAIAASVPVSAMPTVLYWSLLTSTWLLALNVLQFIYLRHRLRLKKHADGYLVDGRGVPYCHRCERPLLNRVNVYSATGLELQCPDCKNHYPFSR